MLVLSSVAVDHLNLAAVSSDGDGKANDIITGLDHLKVVIWDICQLRRSVEK